MRNAQLTGKKLCKTCEAVKPCEDFYMQSGGIYRQPKCKACHKKYTVAVRDKKVSNAYARGLYQKYKEKSLARAATYRNENREKVRSIVNASHKKHAAKRKLKAAERYEKNKSFYVAKSAAWAKANASLCAAQSAKRRAYKAQATPAWADHEAIADVYREAEYMQLHVDHIVPLKSKVVCGLHVESNLQLLTMSENSRKGNSRWPDMP